MFLFRRNTEVNISRNEKMLEKAFKFWTCYGKSFKMFGSAVTQTHSPNCRTIRPTSRPQKLAGGVTSWTKTAVPTSPLWWALQLTQHQENTSSHTREQFPPTGCGPNRNSQTAWMCTQNSDSLTLIMCQVSRQAENISRTIRILKVKQLNGISHMLFLPAKYLQ